MEKDKRLYVLSEEKPAKAVVKLGIPLVAGMFIMVLYNLVDTYFIGLLKNDYQLAAVNLAYPVMMIMIAVSNMIGTGASSLIARSIGADDFDKADKTLSCGCLLTIINSIIVSVLGLIFIDDIVIKLGAKENTFQYTKEYVTVILIGTIFTMANYTLGQLLRSEGSVKQSVVGMIVGTIANIILDPIFIFAFKMEILGAAIATILANGIAMLSSLSFYLRAKTILKIKWKYFKFNKEISFQIFWVGVPASLETLLTSFAYIVNNNLAVAYGELTVAAMGIAQKILSLGSYVYQGFAAGNQPLMGYNFGAANYKRMREVLKSAILIVSGIEICIMVVYGIFADFLIGIFTDSDIVISTGSKVLRSLMFILPFVGAISMSRTTFQAMGKPQFAFSITLVRQLFLYVPLLILFNRCWGFNGLIWAQPVTELIMMLVSVSLLSYILIKFEKTNL